MLHSDFNLQQTFFFFNFVIYTFPRRLDSAAPVQFSHHFASLLFPTRRPRRLGKQATGRLIEGMRTQPVRNIQDWESMFPTCDAICSGVIISPLFGLFSIARPDSNSTSIHRWRHHTLQAHWPCGCKLWPWKMQKNNNTKENIFIYVTELDNFPPGAASSVSTARINKESAVRRSSEEEEEEKKKKGAGILPPPAALHVSLLLFLLLFYFSARINRVKGEKNRRKVGKDP